MIVRDEARCIARCLESVRPHVDEMIVLDTGSVDDTAAIAASLGARVERFDWIDDFSAARNAALDLSDADWNLILDADDRLVGGAATLADLGRTPFIGELRIENTFEGASGAETAVSWALRLLPRGVRYEGRVHEQPVGGALPHRRLDVSISHDGYEAAQRARKAGRNEALLRAELATAPDDTYLLFQLGRELQAAERWAEAADYLARAYNGSSQTDRFRHALVVRTLFTLKSAGRHDEALAVTEMEFERWPHSPDFFFAVGDLYLDWGLHNPDRAVKEALPLVEYCWLRCLEIGEQPDLEGSVRGRGSWLAANNLAVFYGTLKLTDKAAEYERLAAALKQ
ncbi:family 2 glycosyl transferase [Caulobacter mirabilis]|uniref:Family 2 glycosyl transferase n=2 Tax=Caulobacter mirabilis TaxID=69666 RepID=A0A2D2B3S5_9CAUL|nr:family 2 glycosyl transferase [Caulobacter mirabilis]